MIKRTISVLEYTDWGREMSKENKLTQSLTKTYNTLTYLNNKQLKEYLKGYQFSELHCIAYIETIEDANVTKLAEALHMTRGGISKLTKKLIKEKAIETYQSPNNKKEIYFKLTDLGKEMSLRHKEVHRIWEERDKAIYNLIPDEEKEVIINFLEKFNDHLEMEIKKMENECDTI